MIKTFQLAKNLIISMNRRTLEFFKATKKKSKETLSQLLSLLPIPFFEVIFMWLAVALISQYLSLKGFEYTEYLLSMFSVFVGAYVSVRWTQKTEDKKEIKTNLGHLTATTNFFSQQYNLILRLHGEIKNYSNSELGALYMPAKKIINASDKKAPLDHLVHIFPISDGNTMLDLQILDDQFAVCIWLQNEWATHYQNALKRKLIDEGLFGKDIAPSDIRTIVGDEVYFLNIELWDSLKEECIHYLSEFPKRLKDLNSLGRKISPNYEDVKIITK